MIKFPLMPLPSFVFLLPIGRVLSSNVLFSLRETPVWAGQVDVNIEQ